MRVNLNFDKSNYTNDIVDGWVLYDDGKYFKNNYFLIAEDFTPTPYIHPTSKIVWALFYRDKNDIIIPISSWNYATFGPPIKWASNEIRSRENK